MQRRSCCRSTVHTSKSRSTTDGSDDLCKELKIRPAEDLQRTRSETVLAFFLEVRCACNDSLRLKHALVLTSLPFGIPAYLLLRQGTYFLGACAAALTCTSIAYHALHWPAIRAADVLLVWIIGGAGTVQALAALAEDASYPASLPFVLALCGVLALFIINAVPAWFYAPRRVNLPPTPTSPHHPTTITPPPASPFERATGGSALPCRVTRECQRARRMCSGSL